MKKASDLSASSRRNIRLVVAYDGTDFHGWQRQPSMPTVQGQLEETIGRICAEPITLYGSGRTDAGVHALGQVANFATFCRIPCDNLTRALNGQLPPTLRVRQASEVPAQFHARYDVRSKTYRYRIVRAAVCLPFVSRFVWHYEYPLDLARMVDAARALAGEHDFTSFAASANSDEDAGVEEAVPVERSRSEARETRRAEPGETTDRQPHSAVRTIFASKVLWRKRTEILTYEVQGSGFLHHMVRNMVGTLVEVGRGKLSATDVVRILRARDRTLAGPTAPAQGLCLVRVDY